MSPTTSVISATNFQSKRPRKDKDHILKLDEKRFEPINKDPFIKSDVKRCTGVLKLGNLTGRDDLWKKATECVNGQVYEQCSDNLTMRNLTQGIPILSKSIGRKTVDEFNWKTISSCNLSRAYDAEKKMTRPKNVNLTNFRKHKARDDVMLKQTDRLAN